MASTSNADSTPSDADSRRELDAPLESGLDRSADVNAEASDDSPSVTDRLDAVATAVWAGFLALVVVFTLLPVVGLLAGVAPFDAPDPTPYLALVGVALVGTVALVGAAILDA